MPDLRIAPFVAGVFGAVVAANVAAGQNVCSALSAGARFPATTIDSAAEFAADATRHLPAFCEVHATISPVEGSHIGAVYRLPADWNGKVLGIGGGGYAGNVGFDAAVPGLERGYAIIQNDLGHPSANALDPSFAIKADGKPNVPGLVDFGHRATHLATTVGKDIVERVYGRVPAHAYWQGCSTGGRQGLAEVQRYPGDYDGVIAGAPVFNALVYSNAILRTQAFHKRPGSNLSAAQVPLIRKAVLAACDAKDGLEDGILTDPRKCRWDPGALQCRRGESGDRCLTSAQVRAVRRIYAGVRGADGHFAAMPLMRGGESDWGRRMIGTPKMPLGLNALLGAPFVSYIVKHDPHYDILSFDPQRDMRELEGGIAAREIYQTNADLSGFVKRGGRLLLWHGFNDPGPSPLSTIAYYESVLKTVPAARKDVRLFLAPGVFHCGGGPGPDRFDALTAMERWVERGTPPKAMIASKADSALSRPLCPYPQLPRYKGEGDPSRASSFRCAAR